MSPRPRDIGGDHFRDLPPGWNPKTHDWASNDIAAAWLQYRASAVVWRKIQREEVSLQDVGDLMDESAENQRKKLSGQTWASLSDIVGWALAFDDDLTSLLITEPIDLFPEGLHPATRTFRPGRHRLPELNSGPIAWLDTLRAFPATLSQGHIYDALSTVTSEVLRYLLVAHIAETGIEDARFSSPHIGSRSISRLEIDAVDGVTRIDTIVQDPDSDQATLLLLNAIGRCADAGNTRNSWLVVLALPGKHRLPELFPQPLIDDGAQHELGPIELDSTAPQTLREWWHTAHVEVSARWLGVVGEASLYALNVRPQAPTA